MTPWAPIDAASSASWPSSKRSPRLLGAGVDVLDGAPGSRCAARGGAHRWRGARSPARRPAGRCRGRRALAGSGRGVLGKSAEGHGPAPGACRLLLRLLTVAVLWRPRLLSGHAAGHAGHLRSGSSSGGAGGARSGRRRAIDEFAGELEVALAAARSAGRTAAPACRATAPRDSRTLRGIMVSIDLVAQVPLDLVADLAGEVGARVVHAEQHALERQARVDARAGPARWC